jgi:Ca2+-binding EF-hand superfamily protein
VFINFDLQQHGVIALKDLRKIAKDLWELTDDTILQEMIERADTDRDGVVSEEDFYNLINKKTHWPIQHHNPHTLQNISVHIF